MPGKPGPEGVATAGPADVWTTGSGPCWAPPEGISRNGRSRTSPATVSDAVNIRSGGETSECTAADTSTAPVDDGGAARTPAGSPAAVTRTAATTTRGRIAGTRTTNT